MKKFNFSVLLLIGVCLAAVTALAQTNSVPSNPTSLSDFPTSTDALWSYAISIVAPVLVWLLAKYAPMIPKPFLPVVTPLIGLGLGFALNKLAGANLGWVDMAKAGALAVFIRETTNQWITKQLNGEAAADKAAAATPPPAPPVNKAP
jgi:hypothetical protein